MEHSLSHNYPVSTNSSFKSSRSANPKNFNLLTILAWLDQFFHMHVHLPERRSFNLIPYSLNLPFGRSVISRIQAI